MKVGKNKQAFTIVELLVVIVVIGILAAITIVSYSGIQKRAIGSNLQSDLSSDARQLKMYNVEYGHYPSSLDGNNCPLTPEHDTRYCLKSMNGAKLSYVGGGQAFTLFDKHTSTGITYKISEGSTPTISVLPGSFINLYGAGNASDSANAVDITNDDGYVVAGTRAGNSMFAKFNPDNSMSWAKYNNFVAAGINAIKQTSDGGVVVTGTNSSGLAGGSHDSFIAKYSSTNQLSWMKIYGSSSYDHGNSVIQTQEGGYAVAGLIQRPTPDWEDIAITRFSSDGSLLWAKVYNIGGLGDLGNSIIQTSDLGFAVVGKSNTTGIILKTDSNGNVSWAKSWKNSSIVGSGETGKDLVQTSDGGYAIAGSVTVSAGKTKATILKLAPDGSYQWHNYLEGTNNIGFYSIVQSYDGSYAMAGGIVDASKNAARGEAALAKVSSSGTLQWSRSYGNTADSESLSELGLTADGGYLAVGARWIGGAGSNNQMLVMKYKSDGTMNNCISPTCKNDLVYSGGNNITFADATVAGVSQTYTVVGKTYSPSDAIFSQTVVAAP